MLATPPLLHSDCPAPAMVAEIGVLCEMGDERAFRDVEAVKPAAGYIGGKRQLANRLVAMIEAIPHETYAEPFVGMGGVFFRRRLAPKGEIVNDRSGDVATFFRVQLAAVLSGLKGRFILTLNDVPPVRRVFAGFKMRRVKVTYMLAGGHRTRRAGELIVTGVK